MIDLINTHHSVTIEVLKVVEEHLIRGLDT